MIMKTRSIILPAALAAAFLTGCQLAPRQIPAQQTPAVASAAKPLSEVDEWLLARQRLCGLPAVEQRAQLLERAARDASSERKIERVLLASCHPDQTPGLLRQALNGLDANTQWSPGQRALLAMIHDHARSYRILEEKNTELATQLETTINGIRDIETDMDSLQHNGSTP